MILSGLIDRARASMGWNRLPQSGKAGESSEQDVHIITWFEVLSDAGVRVEEYTDCFRAARQRKRELLAAGQQPTIITPDDLVVERDKVRQMHAELDRTHLLPDVAASGCPRCLGTGMERMPDGSVRPGCAHEYRPSEPPADVNFVAETAAMMREALKKIGSPKPPPPPPKPAAQVFTCDECGRQVSSEFGWREGETCNVMIPGPEYMGRRLVCEGTVK